MARKKVAKKAAKKVTKKAAKKVVRKATKKVAKKTAKKTSKKATKKVAKKVSKKSSKKKVIKAKPAIRMTRTPDWVAPIAGDIGTIKAQISILTQSIAKHFGVSTNALNVTNSQSATSAQVADKDKSATVNEEQTSAIMDGENNENKNDTTEDSAQTSLFDEAPTTQETPTVTKEDINQALRTVAAKAGMPKCIEILESFGAKKISDVTEADYSDFIEACNDVN